MTAFQKNPLNLKNDDFLKCLQTCAQDIEGTLDEILPPPSTRLHEAMRYSVLGGGKRLRPFLTWASAQLFSVDSEVVLKVGAAIELIHAYSLVHDDLPCMDNADFRRGKSSCHKAYGEATAVLVGDALIPLAFQVLSSLQMSAEVKLELMERFAEMTGSQGLVAGQMMDLKQEEYALTLDNLIKLQQLKTGQLFEFSVEAGGILGQATAKERQALKSYGILFGQAFQMIDDLLDYWGTEELLGKPSQQDQEKLTFLRYLSPEEVYEKIELTLEKAFEGLSLFQGKTDFLKGAAIFAFSQLDPVNKGTNKPEYSGKLKVTIQS